MKPQTADGAGSRPAAAPAERRSVPQRLKAYWMAFALRLGGIQTQILLALMYVLVFGAANLGLRLLGKDLLGKRARKASYWVAHDRQPETLDRWRRQF